MAEKRNTPAQQRKLVERFNRKHPVGTVVDIWPTVRGWGEPTRTKTRTPAQMLSGHTAVVWTEARSDCIALTHVDVIERLENEVPGD